MIISSSCDYLLVPLLNHVDIMCLLTQKPIKANTDRPAMTPKMTKNMMS